MHVYAMRGAELSEVTTLHGPADTQFGIEVASAGDVNGDGYADLLVAERDSEAWRPPVLLYLGGPEGVGPRPAATLGPPPEFERGASGVSVASAGDIDQDGYGDIIVAARDRRFLQSVRVCIYRGGPEGLSARPAHEITVPDVHGHSHLSVAAADVNGDTYPDVMLAISYIGRAYVYLGTGVGLDTAAPIALDHPPTEENFGRMVAGADIDGDGYADVLVGSGGRSQPGRVHVYSGGLMGVSAVAAETLDGPAPHGFGYSVAPAGDVNADGYADVIFGGADFSAVYRGGAAGLGGTTATILTHPPVIGLGHDRSVGVGDIDGDGYADVLTGVPWEEDVVMPTNAGRAILFRGGPEGAVPSPAATLVGTGPLAFFGYATAGIQ